MSSEPFVEVMSRDQYRDKRTNMFPSSGSLDWFLRQHRPELVSRGALLLHAGRWVIQARVMDEYVMAAGRRAALRQCGAEPGRVS